MRRSKRKQRVRAWTITVLRTSETGKQPTSWHEGLCYLRRTGKRKFEQVLAKQQGSNYRDAEKRRNKIQTLCLLSSAQQQRRPVLLREKSSSTPRIFTLPAFRAPLQSPHALIQIYKLQEAVLVFVQGTIREHDL